MIELVLGLTASLVVLIGVFVVTVFEIHRTAGAVFNLAPRLEQVADGDSSSTLRLRKDKTLRELSLAAGHRQPDSGAIPTSLADAA